MRFGKEIACVVFSAALTVTGCSEPIIRPVNSPTPSPTLAPTPTTIPGLEGHEIRISRFGQNAFLIVTGEYRFESGREALKAGVDYLEQKGCKIRFPYPIFIEYTQTQIGPVTNPLIVPVENSDCYNP